MNALTRGLGRDGRPLPYNGRLFEAGVFGAAFSMAHLRFTFDVYKAEDLPEGCRGTIGCAFPLVQSRLLAGLVTTIN